MSSQTRHAFDTFRRERSDCATLPPPPMGSQIAELEHQHRIALGKASRALARALDLEAQIAVLKGTRK